MTSTNKILHLENIQREQSIRVYSDLNSQIDFIVLTANQEDSNRARSIINLAWDKWWDLENNPDLQYIPIADYISEQLASAEVDFEIYY